MICDSLSPKIPLPKGRTTMSEKPRSKSARLQELIHRRDKVLAVLHPPTAAHARIMEKAGCEALFVGTGGVVGAYTGLADVGTATMTECVTITGWIADSVSIPVIMDGDTGHGGIMAVRRMVRECIRRGTILSRYLSAAETERLAAWEPYRAAGRNGHVTYNRGQRHYRRRLGDARPDEAPFGYMAGFTGVARERDPSPKVDADPAARIADMDYEGVDVNLTLPSGWFGTFTAGDDIPLEAAMYRAYHRWMSDYCGAHPRRLGGVILAGARDIAGSLGEIREWGKSGWAWGVMV